MSALLALILSTYHPPVVVYGGPVMTNCCALQIPNDTGMGKCRMDQHWHNSDASCHRDSDDSVVKILPKVK